MSWPTALTEKEFDKYWKIDSYNGTPQSYGYHDGWDLNLKTGGNTDLGKPVYALSKYKLAYYHAKSHLESGFGCHVVYEIETKNGKRWVHCAHLLPDPPILKYPEGGEGTIIGYVGATGRPRGQMASHLHISIFKKDPGTSPRGIDIIATSKAILNEWWEDPAITMENLLTSGDPTPTPEKTYSESEMTAVRLERDKNWNLYQSQLAETEQYKSEANARKKEYDDLLSELAQKLTLPTTSDKPSIMGAIDRTLEVEDQLRIVSKKYDAEVQARKADSLKYQEQLQSFTTRIDKMEENHTQEVNDLQERHQQEIERLRSDLEKALKEAEVANEALITVTRFSSFWKGITRLIKG